ncbi:MAG TPA: isochorismate synthase [Thermoanaerobaculia bacterium]|nr:isochorismate synthase [Thermoanaerobaculia bacterium]
MSVAAPKGGLVLGRAALQIGIAEALRRLRPDETGLIALPLPEGDPAAVLALHAGDAFLWRSAEETWVGLGAALCLRGHGAERFVELRSAAERASAGLRWFELAPGARALAGSRARWFGGLSFASGSAESPPWDGFGDSEMVLPRWLVGGDGVANVAVLALSGATEVETALERALAELDDIVAALCSPDATPVLSGIERETHCNDEEAHDGAPARRQRYRDTVERALVAIATGRARKLVPVRRVEIDLSAPVDLVSLLARFGRAGAPKSSALFAIVRGDRAFVGATPERLVRLLGRLVETHALAGSERAGRPGQSAEDADSQRADAARRLSSRPKDRREHAWVVRHLVERLRPLCSRLDWAAEPQVLALQHVLHLETEIDGELRERRHVLELVERLHPTPAVAGYPVAAAGRWLAEQEESLRGWYAGPVGWFDDAGDGDFRVALRAMLVTPSRAFLYAGAGVVEGSDPEAELRETDLKLEPARSALQETPDLEPAGWDARVAQPV